MPELPEVETIKNDLRKKILNRKIKRVKVNLKRIVKSNFNEFLTFLSDNKITDIKRIGKLLIFKLAGKDNFLIIHLKMTGQLIYYWSGKIILGGHADKNTISDLPNKYTRVIIEFSNGGKLFFNDMRTFGYMKLVSRDELKKIIVQFGPEPGTKDFNFRYLKKLLSNRTANIKSLLLNQGLVAGIGNIYADEILFKAGVLPERPGGALGDDEIKKIQRAASRVIKTAIKYRGTTFNDYVDANGNTGNFLKRLKVYGRAGEKCKVCGGIVKKKKVAGRGTHYCAKCQS